MQIKLLTIHKSSCQLACRKCKMYLWSFTFYWVLKDTYLTISKTSEGIYKEKGSKFLAFAYPVAREEEVKEHLDELKKKYYDARHHCFAFILGRQGQHYRANDDGEPGHSAGDPILGQIRSRNLTDTLVVVVRYFGGTKLGVPGLINAYKTSAGEALDNSGIIEKIVTQTLRLKFEYAETSAVMRLVKDYDLEVADQRFEADCFIQLKVKLSQEEEVRAKIASLASVKLIED